MKLLLNLVTRVMDGKCRDWEARSEVGHRIPDDVEEFLDVPFRGAGGAPLMTDIFRPKESSDPLPVAVMIHGGGLVVGTRKLARSFSENLASKGYLVFAPEYRLAQEAEAVEEIGDVYAAFSFISEHLAEYGGDPDRVSVISESAGSFLGVYAVASLYSPILRKAFGLEEPSLRVRSLACFSGMFYTLRWDLIRLTYASSIYGKRRKDKEFMRLMDPECREVVDNLPPVFLVGSDADFLKGYTKRYSAALQGSEHPCGLLFYTGKKELDHAFPSLKTELPESREVLERLVEWMGRITDKV